MTEWNEAAVTINDQRLSIGQVLALRVACSHFHAALGGKLGKALDDERLRANYSARLAEVLTLLTEESPQ